MTESEPRFSDELIDQVTQAMVDVGVTFVPPEEQTEMVGIDINGYQELQDKVDRRLSEAYQSVL